MGEVEKSPQHFYAKSIRQLIEQDISRGRANTRKAAHYVLDCWPKMTVDERKEVLELIRSYYRISVVEYRAWKALNNKEPYSQWKFRKKMERLFAGSSERAYAPGHGIICTLGNFNSFRFWAKTLSYCRRNLC